MPLAATSHLAIFPFLFCSSHFGADVFSKNPGFVLACHKLKVFGNEFWQKRYLRLFLVEWLHQWGMSRIFGYSGGGINGGKGVPGN